MQQVPAKFWMSVGQVLPGGTWHKADSYRDPDSLPDASRMSGMEKPLRRRFYFVNSFPFLGGGGVYITTGLSNLLLSPQLPRSARVALPNGA